MEYIYRYIKILITAFCCLSCSNTDIQITKNVEDFPEIFPDYKDVTIPYNIAPLNFSYVGEGDVCLIISGKHGELQIKGKDGLFSFQNSTWRKLMQENKGDSIKLTVAVYINKEWVGCKPFFIKVSIDPIDPYISYRLIPPGYEGWKDMGIYQRDLETFEETSIFENKLTNHNCVNCHAYCERDPSKMMFHVRAEFDGTVLIQDEVIEKLNTKTDSTVSTLVYPYWHPSGKYIAFSVNKTMQNFFNHHPNRIEVYDVESDVVVYNVQTRQISYSSLTKSANSFETFPAFSPDGRSLYFCSAPKVDSLPLKYDLVRYNLCRITFNPEDMSFGSKVDTLYNAQLHQKSVSFPRVSPDGKNLVFTLHNWGNFSIWHKEADLWKVNLQTEEVVPLAEVNSDDVESYHSWSSNSRWLIFSSRRTNGLYTRPFIVYVDEKGETCKPFLLPQNNPLVYYKQLMFSYNIPEFMIRKVETSKYKIKNVLRESKGINVTVKRN